MNEARGRAARREPRQARAPRPRALRRRSRSPSSRCKVQRFARELGLDATFCQTNHEGEFCEKLHRAGERADGLILNPGAWTHYSYAIRDALEVAGAARGRGAPLRGRRARGVAARLGDPRPVRRPRAGQGRRRLPRGARDAQGGARSVTSTAEAVADATGSLVRRLEERELDCLLVTNLVNVRYLTGFTGTNGACVVTPRRAPLPHRLPLRRAGRGAGARASSACRRAATCSATWPSGCAGAPASTTRT